MRDILISIVSIVFISIGIDVLLPNKDMSRYIKSIFGIVLLLAIITPILDIKEYFNEVEDNYSYVYIINQLKLDTTYKNIDYVLSSNGYNGISVEIYTNLDDFDFKIDGIDVNLSNMVLSEDNMNIHTCDEILRLILSVVDIDEDKVVFYE